jgi:amino acid adenylation domain-containing protein
MPSPFSLTHSQTPIWIGQQLHSRIPLYNMAFAFVFPTTLRGDAFAEAWRRVADASDALRTRVVEDQGRAAATVAPVGPGTTIEQLPIPDDPAAFRDWCRQRCTTPLDAGALVESMLVPLGPAGTGWYLNQHHLIADAWSTRLLYRRVAEEYEAVVSGEDRQPRALSSYYETVATLPARTLARPAARAHWTARWSGPGRAVRLYGHQVAPSDTRSVRSTIVLDVERSRAIDRLCQQPGFVSASADLSRFTVFATLLLAWMNRVSGQTDLEFDAPVSGRPTAEAKRTLGVFIEMFPFAASVGPDDTFRSLGARCLEEAMSFLQHALPGLSSPSASTACSVVLNYTPGAFGPFAGVRPEIEWIHPGHGDSVHAVRLQVHDFSGSGRYVLHFDVNQSVLPDHQQRRSLSHFERLLSAALTDPDRRIAAEDMRLPEERAAMAAWSSGEDAPLPDRSVVGIVRTRAHLEPERVVLRQGATEVSYAELLARTEALAGTLGLRGVEPGDRVAIVSRRSIDAVIAILGTLAAGAVWVPLDPGVPSVRLRDALADSGARLVLTGEGLDTTLDAPGAAVLPIAEGLASNERLRQNRQALRLEDLAYLMYTSGSTGRPKGVLVDHGGLADYLCWADRTYVRGDRLTFPLFTALTFDLTLTSLFLPLISGGTLEVYPEPDGPVDTALMDVIAANTADFIKLTPSHLSLLRRVGLDGSRIRRMVVGGEDLTTALAAAVSAQLHGRAEIYNEYGPTEAVVGCIAHRYDPVVDDGSSVPIGRPADHVNVEVLNDALAPVPEGVPGELWISGFGLARGYHGLPAQTAERFQPHPDRPGQRRYRTGDLVRATDAGVLEYLGRVDRQVKVSGFRVEPGEIEAALLASPSIEECAVVIRRHRATATSPADTRSCLRCGLSASHPRARLGGDGICGICRSYEAASDHANAYFRTLDDLRALFEESARTNASPYDCLMLFSGGKDSTYALCQLVSMGMSVYAFTLDNGYIADAAKQNMRRVAAHLGVALEFATTPAMNAIFRDSLARFSNVCNGCFKTIYTLSLQRARELGIPLVVTGLSRGQLFETRLTEEMFRDGRRGADDIDAAVLAARIAYHRLPDEVSRSLDVAAFEDDRFFEQVRVIDFYRYCDVGMDEMLAYLEREVPWVRPRETGRSTNCLINDVGIFVHRIERGYHNYALPYSWDVRLGHKTRELAIAELDDDIDERFVRQTLQEIGYEASSQVEGDQVSLEAFYVAGTDVTDAEVRRHLAERLPSHLIPSRLRRVEAIPLTASAKVDEQALLRDAAARPSATPYVPPEGPVEEYLARVWQEEVGAPRAGATDDFFELGGTSLTAMQVMVRLCQEFDIDLPLATLFSRPRLRDLARVAEDRILADANDLTLPGGS